MKNVRKSARRDDPLEPSPAAASGGDHLMVERLMTAFEHLHEHIVLTDADDRFILANRAFREINQNVAHAIQPGEKFSDYLRAGLAAGNYPDAAGREQEWLEARLAEQRNLGVPVEHQRSNGRWFLIDGRRLPDGCTIRFGTEITKRKRAEAVLNERNRDLQLVVDSVPVMIARLDRDERFLFVNRAYTELMERPAQDIIGRTVGEVVSPETYAQIKPVLNRALRGDPVSSGWVQHRSNGTSVEIEGHHIPDVDVHGRVIGAIAVHRDVTAERRARRALAAGEALKAAMLASALDAIVSIDAAGRIIEFNPAAEQCFGWSRAEALGSTVAELLIPEDLRERHNRGLERLASGGATPLGGRRVEMPALRRDGSRITVELAIVRLPDMTPPVYSAFLRDVTEKVLARARIERMNAELEERVETRTAELRAALKELDAFTYSVSHDLRAPIGAVSGFAHLLRGAEAGRLSEDGLRLLGFIEQNAERMTRLIEGLLRFSRLGRGELRRSRVSMNALVTESLLDLVDEAACASIGAGAMPDCSGDPALLGQVWANLMGNALKYSRDANAPRIDIGWDSVRDAYFVRDNGVGFDMAYAGKLFGVFERLHAESEFEGSGIGLAIAERIVRLHGGAIWADAAPGRGATFWFTVPPAGESAPGEHRSSPQARR